jgi:hypothetical protein
VLLKLVFILNVPFDEKLRMEVDRHGKLCGQHQVESDCGDTDSLFSQGLGAHVFSLIIRIKLTEVLVWD